MTWAVAVSITLCTMAVGAIQRRERVPSGFLSTCKKYVDRTPTSASLGNDGFYISHSHC